MSRHSGFDGAPSRRSWACNRGARNGCEVHCNPWLPAESTGGRQDCLHDIRPSVTPGSPSTRAPRNVRTGVPHDRTGGRPSLRREVGHWRARGLRPGPEHFHPGLVDSGRYCRRDVFPVEPPAPRGGLGGSWDRVWAGARRGRELVIILARTVERRAATEGQTRRRARFADPRAREDRFERPPSGSPLWRGAPPRRS